MDNEPDEPRSPKREHLSKTPSWVMFGFLLGAACVLAWPRKETSPPALRASPLRESAAAEKTAVPPTVDRALYFEGVFAQLGRNAVWQDDVTEVAFWNAAQRAYSDCYEVLRVGDKFYFRSIPRLTRPVVTEGVPADSPLQFTMPAGMSMEIAPTYSWPRREGPTPILAPSSTRPDQVAPPLLPPPKPVIDLPQKSGK